ncbi:MAG TPA: hypothetical protein VL484_13985 [Vicinamibacterales bacterium]|jgi:hypothetical protein|nr:hypothetical protein [Vicinamibacterales bacterium]
MNRLTAGGLALVSVLAGKISIACRLRRPPEGWRRTVGILLRSEPTRFAVSAFGLRVPGASGSDSPERIRQMAARALHRYLSSSADAHFALEWRPAVTIRRRIAAVDVAVLEFSDQGELSSVVPLLADDPAVRLSAAEQPRVLQAIVTVYNQTRRLREVERPGAIRQSVERILGPDDRAAIAFARRLLAATCVSFETVDPSDATARFRPPQFQLRRSLGFGFLTFVIRPGERANEVDVWVGAHHVGLDGVPLQELVSGLEQEWGSGEPIVFPSARSDQAFMPPRTCSVEGERAVDELLAFVDFSPVTALRQAVNARFADRLEAPATFGAVLAWVLESEPEFSGVRIASTVDVAASEGYDRDVDVVPLRPADYASRGDRWSGFIAFANEFNRLIGLSRARRSPLREGMSTAGLLPAAVHAHVVRSNPPALDETFGSLCITIIRDAKVFVAPMTDLGLGHGFFAIGSTNLPSADGTPVAAVSIKGDAGRISDHHAALVRAIARSATLAQALS